MQRLAYSLFQASRQSNETIGVTSAIRSHNNRINFNVPALSFLLRFLYMVVVTRTRSKRHARGSVGWKISKGIVASIAPRKRATEFDAMHDRSIDRSIGYTWHSTESGDRCAWNIICNRGVVSRARGEEGGELQQQQQETAAIPESEPYGSRTSRQLD